MKQFERYRGLEIWQTSPGHLIVLDPRTTAVDRAELVQVLASLGALDRLFFETQAHALAAIDAMVAVGEVGR